MIKKNGARNWRDITITARDGITLYGRHYPAPRTNCRPVLCLAGLTRNSRDFHVLATALSSEQGRARDVFTFDCRGRGQSANAPDWKDYIVPVEMLDVQDFMASQHLDDVALIGTSRGGLIAMAMAAVQPSLIGAVILNDIGPIIDKFGLMRISNYVSQMPTPRTWEDATHYLLQGVGHMFPDVGEEEWADIARQWYNERNGRPVVGYDPQIMRTFSQETGELPDLWPLFRALKRVPCLVIRGALSDLLSQATVEQMCRQHPQCSAIEVPRQGHAPLLRDKPTLQAISKFLAEADDTDH